VEHLYTTASPSLAQNVYMCVCVRIF
jgi:hypothetical protein